MDIVVFAMNQKGLAVIERLLQVCPDNLKVVGARDRQVQNDFYQEIKSACFERGVSFLDRSEAKEPPEYAMAVGWRWIIHDCQKLIVFHDSLLPRYRGFAPLPTALINGESEVGVTALLGSDDYDRGVIFAQKRLPIYYPAKIQEVIDQIAPLYADLAAEIATALLSSSQLQGRPQDESLATYSPWRDEEDYGIDWSWDAQDIRRFIDAVGFPYSGASSGLNGAQVRIFEASVEPDIKIERRVPGKVMFLREGFPIVACGTGMLKLLDIRNDMGSTILPVTKFRSRFQSPSIPNYPGARMKTAYRS